jgi:hypothetical protein
VRNELATLKSELAAVKNAVANSSGSVIKSIQRGVTSTIGNVTINAVDVNKSIVLATFSNLQSASWTTSYNIGGGLYIHLENSTTLNIGLGENTVSAGTPKIAWQVIEFN